MVGLTSPHGAGQHDNLEGENLSTAASQVLDGVEINCCCVVGLITLSYLLMSLRGCGSAQ